jgi:hypothetical protein
VLRLLVAFALATAGAALADESAAAPTCSLAQGAAQSGSARAYEADNLFEYMDGNAEGYLIYGFQKMQGVTCTKGGVTFVIDVSEMADADSAYGILSANRDPRQPSAPIGMGGQIVPRRAIFAKGKYYVEIAANPEGDHTAALREWTAALDRATPGSTTLPTALSWFAKEDQQSLRLVPESVLGIRLLKRGYVAQYDGAKAFVVLEASPESAGAVMQKLRARFGDTTAATIADEGFQANDQYLGRLCIFRKGRFVGGYAGGSDPLALSRALADNVR